MPKYIDADEFDESARQRFCAPCREKKEDYHGVSCRVCWVGDMLDEVDNAPAADVAPVRYGRWVKMTGMMPPEFTGHYRCSECGWCGKGFLKEFEFDFCPGCSAKMNQKGEDDG